MLGSVISGQPCCAVSSTACRCWHRCSPRSLPVPAICIAHILHWHALTAGYSLAVRSVPVNVPQELPVAAAVNKLYESAEEAGHGDADFSAVLEAVLGLRGGR